MNNNEPDEDHPDAPVVLQTKIPILNQHFFFHSVLKRTAFSTHLLAEEVQETPSEDQPRTYFFFKQNLYKHQAEYLNALSYYQRLKNYCQAPLSKNDVIKLRGTYHHDEPENDYFELDLLFDYGESDRIDVEQVQVHQITKFLKNVCLLLLDLKSKTDLYHGNISLKNVVLFQDELKISGFKPIFLLNPDYQNWKTDLVRRTSHYRLDIFMIGLIWLRFLGYKPDTSSDAQPSTFDELSELVHTFYEDLSDDKKTTIVERFLDVEGHPGLTLEEAVMLFDEYFVIEEAKFRKTDLADEVVESHEGWNRDSTVNEPKTSLFNSNDSLKGQDNLFNKNVNESAMEGMTFKNEFVGQNMGDENSKNDNQFSIRDDHTFVAPDRFNTNQTEEESLIVINPNKRQTENNVSENILGDDVKYLSSSERVIGDNNLGGQTKGGSLCREKESKEGRHFDTKDQELGRGKESVRESVKESVTDGRKESLKESLKGSVKESVKGSVKESVTDGRKDSLKESLKGSLKESLKGSVKESVKGSVKESVQNSRKGSVTDGTKGSVKESVKGSVKESVKDDRKESVKDEKKNSVTNDERKESVQNDRKESVANDRKESVTNDRKESLQSEKKNSVNNERKESVRNDRKESINNDRKQSVPNEKKNSVANDRKESVSKDRKESVKDPVVKSSIDSTQNNSKKHSLKDSATSPDSKKRISNTKRTNSVSTDKKQSTPVAKITEKDSQINPLSDHSTDQTPLEQRNSIPESLKKPSDNSIRNTLVSTPHGDIATVASEHSLPFQQDSSNSKQSLANIGGSNNNGLLTVNEANSIDLTHPVIQSLPFKEDSLNVSPHRDTMTNHKASHSIDDLSANIDHIAESSSLAGVQHHLVPEPSHADSALTLPVNLNEQPNKAKPGKKAHTVNPKEQLDLMNQRLKERDLPLNYYDYERNVNLATKKQLLAVVNKVELSEEQKEKIRRQVEDQKQRKLDALARQEEDRKKAMAEKYQSRQKEVEALKAKIELIVDKKVVDKKEVVAEPTGNRLIRTVNRLDVDEAKVTVEGMPVTAQPNKAKKYQSVKGGVAPVKPLSPNHRPYQSVKSGVVPVKCMSPMEREHLFTFNQPLQNKNIPFKKVVTNPQQFIRNSRSPSPLNTTNNFCELKQNVFGRNFDRTVTSAYNSVDKAGAGLPQTTSDDKGDGGQTARPTADVMLSREVVDHRLHLNDFSFDNQRFPVWADVKPFVANESVGKLPATIDQLLKDSVRTGDTHSAMQHFLSIKDTLLPATKLQFLQALADQLSAQNDPNGVKQCLIELHSVLSDLPNLPNQKQHCQNVALTVAELELSGGFGESAIAILTSADFTNDVHQPVRLDRDLTAAYKLAKRDDDLADHLTRRIEQCASDSFKHLDIRQLFATISQVLELLNNSADSKRIVRFCHKVQGLLLQIKRLNSSLELQEHDYENLVECHLLNCLRFAKRVGNHNLSNFLIGEALRNNQIDHVRNMNEDERKDLVGLVVDFCWQLKALEDYGGYKDHFIKYLDFAKEVSKHCDLKPDNLRTSLVIDFNRAVFLMKEGEYARAEELFDQCLTTFYAFFKEDPSQDLFAVFYGLGKALLAKGKVGESVYFFSRVSDGQLCPHKLQQKSCKRLGECLFLLENHRKATDTLGPFLLNHLQDRLPRRFYHYLCMHFVSCQQLGPDEFSPFFKRLAEMPVESLDNQLYLYFKTFKGLQVVYEAHHHFRENQKLVDEAKSVLADKRPPKDSVDRLLHLTASLHNELVNKTPFKSDNKIAKLADLLQDDFLTVEENVINLSRFVLNVLQLTLRLIPLFNDRENSQKNRQDLVGKLREKFPEHLIRESLFATVKEVSKNRNNLADNYFSQEPPDHPESTRPKLTSEQLLNNPDVGSDERVLQDEFGGNRRLQELVTDFLKHIKNLLFLDILENVLTYYLRFEQTLTELGLNFPKYNFVKQLIRFHLARLPGQEISKSTFASLLDGLFGRYSLCRTDLKLLIILLEAFKDVDYLRLFVIYLDNFHPNYATLVVKDLFLQQFMHKSTVVASRFFQQLFESKFHELENCYFMHHLDSHNFLQIPKQFSFKLFLRSRHDLLNDPAFRALFTRYVTPIELNHFDVKYHLYTAVIQLHKGHLQEAKTIFPTFQKRFMEALAKLDPDRNKLFLLVYELLIVAALVRLPQHADAPGVLLQVLDFIVQKFNFNLNFQFSRVLSLMGNVFFKLGRFHECLLAKNTALALMNDDAKVSLAEPPFMPPVTKEQHYFQMLSFQLVANLSLNNLDTVSAVFDKQSKWATIDLNIQFHILVLHALVHLKFERKDDAVKSVYDAVGVFAKMELTPFLNRMHQAILDKITLMVVETSSKDSDLEVIRRKSKLSISKLYE